MSSSRCTRSVSSWDKGASRSGQSHSDLRRFPRIPPTLSNPSGQGLPTALDAARACPGRRAIAFQADGSGLCTVRVPWSMVGENADVTAVV
jgi:thiamine pyrophosphate-dependent acetolactate synthase large subunit-like protein